MGTTSKNWSTNSTKNKGFDLSVDRSLLLVVLSLLGLGVIQVYSSSYIYAFEVRDDALFFFKRQLFFSTLGVMGLFAITSLSEKWFYRFLFLSSIGAVLLMLLVQIPGIGVKAGGAQRWIQLPFGFRFEPSEMIKLSVSVFLSYWLAFRESKHGKVFSFIQLSLFILIFLLLEKQRDFGSIAILGSSILVTLFAFGIKWRYVFLGLITAGISFYVLVVNVPYRLNRIITFLDPWSEATSSGFQMIQSMVSFQSGRLTGVGLGQGQGKLFFLPEAHTDFTLAVFGEEYGFFGFLLLLMVYGYLVFRGFQITYSSDGIFKQALALGLTVTFGLQVFINIGVVLGLLPTKGLTLPFLSYGGSSLLATCAIFGVLLNLEKQSQSLVRK